MNWFQLRSLTNMILNIILKYDSDKKINQNFISLLSNDFLSMKLRYFLIVKVFSL